MTPVTGSPVAATLVQIEGNSTAASFKPSRFNAHTSTTQGKLILYNSFTGHMCSLSANVAPGALRYLSRQHSVGALDPLGQYLLKKGYLVESSVDEDARWDIRYGQQQFRQDRFELILLPSEDCNFRCIYCSQEFKRGTMEPWVRDAIKNLIRARVRPVRFFQLDWFGGEPLLGYEAIEEIAPFALEMAQKYDVKFSGSMTTNGYLLTPERSKALLDWNVRNYQITLDGSATTHDTHRPLQNGQPTFDRILTNLKAMAAQPHDFEVAIRYNFDHDNLKEAPSLMRILRTTFGDDKRFKMRFRAVGKWGGPNDEQLDTCDAKETARQMFELANAARACGLQSEDAGDDLATAARVCYAARPYNLIVGSDGKLMKCTVLLDTDKRNVVGRLLPDGSITMDEDTFALWVKPYYHSDAMCSKCFFVPVCQGVCCPLPRVQIGRAHV